MGFLVTFHHHNTIITWCQDVGMSFIYSSGRSQSKSPVHLIQTQTVDALTNVFAHFFRSPWDTSFQAPGKLFPQQNMSLDGFLPAGISTPEIETLIFPSLFCPQIPPCTSRSFCPVNYLYRRLPPGTLSWTASIWSNRQRSSAFSVNKHRPQTTDQVGGKFSCWLWQDVEEDSKLQTKGHKM